MKAQTNTQQKRIIVLDTSAFLAGFDPFSLSAEQVTVPMVEEEIKRKSMNMLRFTTAIENGKLKVKSPAKEFLISIRKQSSKVGDSFKLSETDNQLLALALELKSEGCIPQIVTDDYSIQNVATQQGIEFLAVATVGIKRLLQWIKYCPACYREYPSTSSNRECTICGTVLKRKPRRTIKSVKGKIS
jgi:UPF0271 protein